MYAYVVNYKDEVWIKLSYGVWTDLKKLRNYLLQIIPYDEITESVKTDIDDLVDECFDIYDDHILSVDTKKRSFIIERYDLY